MKRWGKLARALAEHGERKLGELRSLPYEALVNLDEPVKEIRVMERSGTLGTIIEKLDSGTVRVVVQGFVRLFRLLPFGKHVYVGGFRKRQDGSVEQMESDELCAYD